MAAETADSNCACTDSSRPLLPLHWVAVLLAFVTSGIHLWLGVTTFELPLVAAGIVFHLGIAAVLLNVRRRAVVALGIPFTAGQILLYAVLHGYVVAGAPEFSPLGIADKAVQVALVAVLLVLTRRTAV